ncbi:NADP-dependent oxidoreductase domain-containing protein [Hyaloraphidium curvatum]|nr:NADP-dependent oxidoreductase domain-containing protein [Hyaloraphidium curvatum]
MPPIPLLPLASGASIPAIGLGTWMGDDVVHPQELYDELIEAAVREGVRHIDGAFVYENEPEIGRALKKVLEQGLVKREELFYTSKCPAGMQKPEHLRWSLNKTLEDLGIGYLDLYLLHWPMRGMPASFPDNCNALKDADGKLVIDTSFGIKETWAAMESLVDAGLVRHVGVSNFTVPQLQELLGVARIKPAANQVERHPYLPQPDLLRFCRENGIHVTAYSPLGVGMSAVPCLLADPVVAVVAKKHGCTPAQVLINWNVDSGCSVIPKTSSAKRVKENFARIALDERDMADIAAITTRKRYNDPFSWWKVKLFDDDFAAAG